MEPKLSGRVVGMVVSNTQLFLNSDQHRVVLEDKYIGHLRGGQLFIEDAGIMNGQWKDWQWFPEAAHLIYTVFAAHEFGEVRNIQYVEMRKDIAVFDFELVV
jgi:hypothetical protein